MDAFRVLRRDRVETWAVATDDVVAAERERLFFDFEILPVHDHPFEIWTRKKNVKGSPLLANFFAACFNLHS